MFPSYASDGSRGTGPEGRTASPWGQRPDHADGPLRWPVPDRGMIHECRACGFRQGCSLATRLLLLRRDKMFPAIHMMKRPLQTMACGFASGGRRWTPPCRWRDGPAAGHGSRHEGVWPSHPRSCSASARPGRCWAKTVLGRFSDPRSPKGGRALSGGIPCRSAMSSDRWRIWFRPCRS